MLAFVACGLCLWLMSYVMAFGFWLLVYGVWCMAYGVWMAVGPWGCGCGFDQDDYYDSTVSVLYCMYVV